MYVPGALCKKKCLGQGGEGRVDTDLLRLTADIRDRWDG